MRGSPTRLGKPARPAQIFEFPAINYSQLTGQDNKVTGRLTGEGMRAALGRRSQLVVGLLVPLHRPGGQGHAWAGYADSLWSTPENARCVH